MRLKSLLAVSVLLVFAFIITGSGNYQSTCMSINAKQMREMLTQLGYEVKDLVTDPGKEKYTVTITREGLDIPVAAEISPNL